MGFVGAILERVSLKGVVVFVVASWVLYVVLSYVDKEIRLRRLPGTRAAPFLTRIPLGKLVTSPKHLLIRQSCSKGTWLHDASRGPDGSIVLHPLD